MSDEMEPPPLFENVNIKGNNVDEYEEVEDDAAADDDLFASAIQVRTT